MTIEIKNYDLKDISILNSENSYESILWNPKHTIIVLGRSNKIDQSLNIENVKMDCIPVYKRPSGGEAVVLTSKTLVIALKFETSKNSNIYKYFNKINEEIVGVLKKMGVKNIQLNGISDISLNSKKILGSSMYFSRDILFYHAILNVNESVDTISRYLKHPEREPNYRKSRTHNEFVTSLYKEGYKIDLIDLTNALEKSFLSINEDVNTLKV